MRGDDLGGVIPGKYSDVIAERYMAITECHQPAFAQLPQDPVHVEPGKQSFRALIVHRSLARGGVCNEVRYPRFLDLP